MVRHRLQSESLEGLSARGTDSNRFPAIPAKSLCENRQASVLRMIVECQNQINAEVGDRETDGARLEKDTSKRDRSIRLLKSIPDYPHTPPQDTGLRNPLVEGEL